MANTYKKILIAVLCIGSIVVFSSCVRPSSTPEADPVEPVATSIMMAVEIAATQTASALSTQETQIVDLQKTPVKGQVADLLVILPDNSWLILSKDNLVDLPFTPLNQNGQEFRQIGLTAISEWAKVSECTHIVLFGSGGTLTLSDQDVEQHRLALLLDNETGYDGQYSLIDGEWLGSITIIQFTK